MAIPGVGVDKLVETGRLDHLKGGPVFWVDSADSQPCMGMIFNSQLVARYGSSYNWSTSLCRDCIRCHVDTPC